MNSYLSLVPISAKVKKRQNRMTVLCIIVSVLLVTTIFSVADMVIRTETINMQNKHGRWHIQLKNIAQDTVEEISRCLDITAVGWLEVFNFDTEQSYYINEKKATLYGTDEIYLTQLANGIEEGTYPQSDNEVVLSSSAKSALNVQLGDSVTLYTPAGNVDFIVSGFGSDDKEYFQGQTYLVAVYMTRSAFSEIREKNNITANPVCYVQFRNAQKAQKAILELPKQYHLPKDSISENTAVMGIAGQSSNTSINGIYQLAALLFVLVLLAGVLMISGSMNSTVAQRTKFFGMLRCIGASRQQIIRYVHLEALNWCKTAVPVGLILGTIISWSVCASLRYGIGGDYAATPVFALSPIGIICGAVVGVMTVLLAARSPAKRASKVSPIAAVSGNMMTADRHHVSKLRFGSVDWRLGVHHAASSKRTWLFMTGSFSLSIILLLCMPVGLDFARELVPSLKSWNEDIALNGYANALILDQNLFDKIKAISGVKNIWGTAYLDHIPVTFGNEEVNHVNLISYSDFLLDCCKDIMIQGDVTAVCGLSSHVMAVSDKDNPLKVGDIIQIGEKEVEITCSVSSGIWPGECSIICSQETFEWLTGEQNYCLIGIQLNDDAADTTIQQINSMIGNDIIFSDTRKQNQSDARTYLAAQIVLYTFLAVIAMITIFNIINSISMSVTARAKQYGAMRAVGMDGKQLTLMIAAEAFTYAVSGLVVGCVIGIPMNHFLHVRLLMRYFGIPWRLPIALLVIIILFDLFSVLIAVIAPSKRICNMPITATINEL